MKRIYTLACSWIILLSVVFCSNAQSIGGATPYWLNTQKILMSHDYVGGDAECVIEIVGQIGVTLIDNIDITFLKEGEISGWDELARWEDLSVVGNEFYFQEYVPDTIYGYTYRLTLSFDIHRNGTVEHLEEYFDRLY